MRTDIFIGFFDLFIFLGVFQGLMLSWFFIRKSSKNRQPNIFQGILLFTLSINIFEELLNNTGYIVKLLPVSNYSEPTNFIFGPLVFLYVLSSLKPLKIKNIWSHFIVAAFWFFYMMFYFIQSNEFKYNSYVFSKHPDWETLDVAFKMSEDPLKLRNQINLLTTTHFITYIVASLIIVYKKIKQKGESFLKTKDKKLQQVRNFSFHFLAIVVIFISTKLYYGRDIGDYFIASYISFLIYLTAYQVLKQSAYFSQENSMFDIPGVKYKKSSLTDNQKVQILKKIENEMGKNDYFKNNLASLSGLAKQINESQHHVSQVINEKLNRNFFELLASYRIEFSKKLFEDEEGRKLTIEEVAEQVGYNSKSSFNNAFKRITGQTPSEFKKNNSTL